MICSCALVKLSHAAAIFGRAVQLGHLATETLGDAHLVVRFSPCDDLGNLLIRAKV